MSILIDRINKEEESNKVYTTCGVSERVLRPSNAKKSYIRTKKHLFRRKRKRI